MGPEAEPETDWARHALRINDLIDNQVRALRKRQVIASFEGASTKTGDWRTGAYWGVRSQVGDYGLPDALPCPPDKTWKLATIPTRLKALDDVVQERLINWGYAICDAAMRTWVVAHAPAGSFPYPDAGLGD